MKVKVISTSTTEEQDLESQIAYCARVSNPSNQQLNMNPDKLINYLIKHKHWSPFEMVSIVIEIETTRDIARQILRHRSFSFQEFSQRYATPSLDITTRETRLQDNKNRQNSIETNDELLEQEWKEQQLKVSRACHEAYQWAIQHNIAKEQARVVLPEGLTISKMYMNGTLRSWIHYIQCRSGPDTQKEHREIAIECANVIAPYFPSIKEFLV